MRFCHYRVQYLFLFKAENLKTSLKIGAHSGNVILINLTLGCTCVSSLFVGKFSKILLAVDRLGISPKKINKRHLLNNLVLNIEGYKCIFQNFFQQTGGNDIDL